MAAASNTPPVGRALEYLQEQLNRANELSEMDPEGEGIKPGIKNALFFAAQIIKLKETFHTIKLNSDPLSGRPKDFLNSLSEKVLEAENQLRAKITNDKVLEFLAQAELKASKINLPN